MKLSAESLRTLDSIEAVTSYEDLNDFSMDVQFDYNLDNLTPIGVHDTQKFMELVFEEAIPGVKIDYDAPN